MQKGLGYLASRALGRSRNRLNYFANRALNRTPPFVLMYHRVAELRADPWNLAVTPRHFAEQIEVLTRKRRPISLSRLADGSRPDGAIVITFDDGYIDTLTNAKPVLEKFDCPATVFVPTGLLGRARDFWWDELAKLILESEKLPGKLTIETGHGRFAWERIRSKAEDRAALHDTLWGWLLPLHHDVRDRCLEQLAAQIGVSIAGRPHHRIVNASELVRLSSDLIEIGAHTVNHPALPMLGADEKRAEVIGSQRDCEALLGRRTKSFAFPYGLYDEESLRAVRDAGFSVACTAEHAPVTLGSTNWEIPRIYIRDWDGETFSRLLDRHFPQQFFATAHKFIRRRLAARSARTRTKIEAAASTVNQGVSL